MANKVKFGLKNVYYSIVTETITSGVISYSYGTPVHIPGAVNLSLDIEGDTNTFYADNTAYYQSIANNGYTGTLEMALIPDTFRTAALGDTLSGNKVLAEFNDQKPAAFALAFQVEGDDAETCYWYYNVLASRPKLEQSTTEDTIEPKTETLDVSIRPRIKDGLVRIKSTDTTPAATITAWFNAVLEPTAAST